MVLPLPEPAATASIPDDNVLYTSALGCSAVCKLTTSSAGFMRAQTLKRMCDRTPRADTPPIGSAMCTTAFMHQSTSEPSASARRLIIFSASSCSFLMSSMREGTQDSLAVAGRSPSPPPPLGPAPVLLMWQVRHASTQRLQTGTRLER